MAFGYLPNMLCIHRHEQSNTTLQIISNGLPTANTLNAHKALITFCLNDFSKKWTKQHMCLNLYHKYSLVDGYSRDTHVHFV